MRFKTSLILAAVLVGPGIAGCNGVAETPGSTGAAAYAFRDAQNKPPSDWNGPKFDLSDSYPAEHPGECDPAVCTWLQLDVDYNAGPGDPSPVWGQPAAGHRGTWEEYVTRVKDYAFEAQDQDLKNESGFVTEVNGKTRWFHVPWMAYNDTSGREFVHGTTNERTAHLSDFMGHRDGFGVNTHRGIDHEKCGYPHGFETWAVGFYNEWGGYSIGRAFPEGVPAIGSYMGSPMPEGLPFSEGTAVVKLLFTNAPVSCVPYLKNSAEWQVNRHKRDQNTGQYSCDREVQVSRLVQVDIAVVDPRAPMGWFYGTFAYDGNASGATVVDRLVAVGGQWGSDPWTFPAVPDVDATQVWQSVRNPGLELPAHMGCGGMRLAGPVDNPQSSCISCHASGYAAPDGVLQSMGTNVPPSFGFPGLCDVYSQDNVNYFQNVVMPQGYPGGNYPHAFPLDTSLQLAVAFASYGSFNTNGAPANCENPNQF